jgi:hypothetical protein
MTMNDTSKIVPLEPEACKISGMKEESYEEKDTDHCFVYDMAKSRGGDT